jgi:hypothetical protein
MTKKKRGRKPKNNIIVNNNPKFDNEKNTKDNLILHINNKYSNNLDDNLSLDNLDDDLSNHNLNDNIDDNLSNYNLYDNLSNYNLDKKCNYCNCNIEDKIHYLPVKYDENIFYLNKYYCSHECIKKQIFYEIEYNTHEIYSIYLLYNNMIKNKYKFNIKYINDKKINVDNENYNYKNNLKLFRCKKENNILEFINNI